MKIFRDWDSFLSESSGERVVGTMGFFDGFHLGHQYLIEQLKSRCAEFTAERTLVITLDRAPRSLFGTYQEGGYLLTTIEEKEQLLTKTGVDYLFILPFDLEESKRSVEDFVSRLRTFGVCGMLLGYDNRFGKKDAGERLEDFDLKLASLGMPVLRVGVVELENKIISSTAIRKAIEKHNYSLAERMLGRPYSIAGVVQHGRAVGRTIGYPTANIETFESEKLLPPLGIFVTLARLEDGSVRQGMMYYGQRPTFDEIERSKRVLEVHLFDYDADLYGMRIELFILHYIRSDRKFASLDELKRQLDQDAKDSKKYFAYRVDSERIKNEIEISIYNDREVY